MEDDNAGDIFKWLFQHEMTGDLSEEMKLESVGKIYNVQVKLRVNILAIVYREVPIEPVIIILERIYVEAITNDRNELKYGFMVSYKDCGCAKIYAGSEEQRAAWMIKLSTCSHRIAQAELHEIIHSFDTAIPASAAAPVSANSYRSFFLAAPLKAVQNFSLSQPSGLHSRRIRCEELMWESKLSFILPQQLLKLFLKWTNEMKEALEHRLWIIPKEYLETAHNCLRYISANQETFINSIEFIESYNGTSFRPSSEKFRVAFCSVPTNLHVQQFTVEATTFNYMTTGAVCAAPFRFVHGGLSHLKINLHTSINNPERIDHMLDSRFFCRRRLLRDAKSLVGELSEEAEIDWDFKDLKITESIGLRLLARIKQLKESLVDFIESFPGVTDLLNICWDHNQMLHSQNSDSSLSSENLDSRMENLEASIISLNTKVAVLCTSHDNEDIWKEYENNAKQALNACLDLLLQIIDCLDDAQFLGLVLALTKPADCQKFFNIQLRSDLVLSQAITIVSTALLLMLEKGVTDWCTKPPLITLFSFLSCYGDERGMMEDSSDCWASFHDRVMFKFILNTSSVSSACIPILSGDRVRILVQLPLPKNIFENLPDSLKSGEFFTPSCVFWNLGVNHEATLAQSIAGDSSLEVAINIGASKMLKAYANSWPEVSESVSDLIDELCTELLRSPSNKNLGIFRLVMSATLALGGMPVISCKSGKDRSGMAITLEEGRIVRENCGVSAEQVGEMVVCLRRDGVRRENCRKNVGKPLYSFSPFQLHFIPKELRPPYGTYTAHTAS